MRPIYLEVEGFGSFREKTKIDFSDSEIFAIVGKTGSGKSTIIDAITFALYGSISRYGIKAVAPIINQLENEAKVRLDFELNDSVYTVVRILRRNSSDSSKASTKETRLERKDQNGSAIIGVNEVDESVRKLIGLDFNQFNRTIILPQGEFAQFLKDKPSERQKLLKKLLGVEIFSIMGSKARDEKNKLSTQIDLLETQLASKNVSSEVIKSQQLELAEAEKAQFEISKQIDDHKDNQKTLLELRSNLESVQENINVLKSCDLDQFSNSIALNQEQLKKEEDELKAEIADLDNLKDNLVQQQNETFLEFETIEEQLKKYKYYDELLLEHKKTEKELKTVQPELKEQNKVLEGLKKDLQKLDIRYRKISSSSEAEHIKAGLKVGESCPVCEQLVTALPKPTNDSKKLSDLKNKIDPLQNKIEELSKKIMKLNVKEDSLKNQLAIVAAEVADLENELNKIEDKDILNKKINLIKESSLELKEIEKKQTEKQKDLTKVNAEIEKISKEISLRLEKFQSLRDVIARVSSPPKLLNNFDTDLINLQNWKSEQLTIQKSTLASTNIDVSKMQEISELQLSQLEDTLSKISINFNSVSEVPSQVQSLIIEKTTQLNNLKASQEEAKKIKTQLKEIKSSYVVYDSLSKYLTSSRFEAWVLQEALNDIVDRAKVLLASLSSNRYSLDLEENNFIIVDHANADERRDVRSLSGGETFLTSLALALGLSESLKELNNNANIELGSIFIDEGFGTLDSETLDSATSAIEELSSTGRMVGVVSHVRELADRLPTRFEVKSGSKGSTVEKVET